MLSLLPIILCPLSTSADVTVIGAAPDLTTALAQYAIDVSRSTVLSAHSAVAVCNSDYPEPARLSASQVSALEQHVASGGRAYVEHAVPSGGGTLFGTNLPDAWERAQHQRLFVTGDCGPELELGDILEEHNSARIVPTSLPDGARTLLTYGLLIGTYQVKEADAAFTVTLDLGETTDIRRVSQRYGAGQPNYLPESVTLLVGETLDAMSEAGRTVGRISRSDAVAFSVRTRARFVRLAYIKYKRSDVTDFFFMGEIEVTDETGANVALNRPYTLSPAAPSGKYGDSGTKLTDGVTGELYTDGLSVGWNTQGAALWEKHPGLIEVDFGEGQALIALTKFSDFSAREYRLTERWQALNRHIALWIVDPSERAAVSRRYVPLRVWAEPRNWIPTGSEATLHVETAANAEVSAGGLELSRVAPGRYEAALQPADGDHAFRVRATTPGGLAEATAELRVSARDDAYRSALDRNMQWFRNSGVLPKPDGSAGVWSQRCLAWFDGGPDWSLASPFRVDCNSATSQALYAYGALAGDGEFQDAGLSVARSMLPHQYVDPALPTYGGWPWLYEGVDAIYFWDDNTRIAVALLWLYAQTGDQNFLRAGLRTMELCRDVAQPDGLIARHVISASQLDQIGREDFRRLPPMAVVVDFDLLRWAWAHAVTGDAEYKRLLDAATETWGSMSAHRGVPFASGQADRLEALWANFLELPSVQQHGVMLAGPGDYRYAYTNDCSITTDAGEPLVDNLYTTPALFQQALWAHHAAGDGPYLDAFHAMGDFLVRTQFESDDPRIDGAWMRGFDVQRWENYGAPYDPNYGPYSAYTGWSNAFISTALAQYLSGDSPLPPTTPDPRASEILTEIRAERPPSPRPSNVAVNAAYDISPSPSPTFPDAGGELTDGVLDGHYPDQKSIGWVVPEGEMLRVTITIDLGEMRTVAGVAQRHGAGMNGYCPDRIEVLAGATPQSLAPVIEVLGNGAGAGRRFVVFGEPVTARHIRVVLSKRRAAAASDWLFVGETEVFEEL